MERKQINRQLWKKEKMLESEIQTAIEKAHEAVKSHAQISVATASHSEFVAHPSPPIVLQGSLNPTSPPPPSQSAHSSQGEAGVPESPPASHSTNHRLKPLKVPSYGGDKTKFEEFWGLFESLFESLVQRTSQPKNGEIEAVLVRQHTGSDSRSWCFRTRIRRDEGNLDSQVWRSAAATAGLHGPAGENAPNEKQ